MSRQENSFALLGDEEVDDVSTLLERVAAKVEASSPPAAAEKKKKKEQQQRKNQQSQSPPAVPKFPSKPLPPADYVRSERGRGGWSRSSGSYTNDVEQFENGWSNGYQRNKGGADGYQRNNGGADGYQRNNGGSDGYRRNNGTSDGYRRNNGGSDGYWRNNRGSDSYQQKYRIADGYQQNYGGDSAGNTVDGNWQEQGRGHGGGRGRGRGQGRGSNEDHGFGNEIQVVGGNQQLENQGQEGADGHYRDERQLRNGNRSYGGEIRGNGGGSRGYRAREGHSFREHGGRNNGKGGVMNNSGTKEALGDTGGRAINVDDNNGGAVKNVPAATEVSKDAESEQGKLEAAAFQDYLKKKAQEEEEENKKMTLEQYEKLLVEKRKSLGASKTVARKVSIDKDFESMQLVEKKIEDSLVIKLKSEKDKLKRKDSLEKDEKVHKAKVRQLPLDEIFRIRRSRRGRGRGEEQGGHWEGVSGWREAVPASGDSGQFPERGGYREGGDSGRQETAPANGDSGQLPGRGGYRGGYLQRPVAVPAIGDSGQFPDLGKAAKA